MSYPTPMDVAESDDFAADDYCEDGCMLMGPHNACDTAKSEDTAADALDAALDWPYSREAWDQIDAERLELLAVNDALELEVERMTAHAKVFATRLAEAERLLRKVIGELEDPRLSQWSYVESGDMNSDFFMLANELRDFFVRVTDPTKAAP